MYTNLLSRCNNWRQVATRPKRPMKSIVLDPGIKDLILGDARDFLESKTWYQERGIPFRRGYLLVSPFSIDINELHILKDFFSTVLPAPVKPP